MIKASPEEALSVFRGWMDSNARIRFVASLHAVGMSVDCSVFKVDSAKVGLLLPGPHTGVCSIELSGCEFFFGAEDAPSSEGEVRGLKLDAGISVITEDGESLWLIEEIDG